MQIVYSTRKHPALTEGRLFQNPHHFAGAVDGAKKVFIDGEWPEVERAYTKAGIPVLKLDDLGVAKPAKAAKSSTVADDLAAKGVSADPKA